MNVPSRLPAAKAGATVSRTKFVLVGTIVSSTPSARRAILWAEGMKEPRAYRESEEVEPGAVLSSVERETVWLARGSGREKLDLLPVGSRSRVPAAVQTSAPPAACPAAPPQTSAAQGTYQPVPPPPAAQASPTPAAPQTEGAPPALQQAGGGEEEPPSRSEIRKRQRRRMRGIE
jgi:hypothetical protein